MPYHRSTATSTTSQLLSLFTIRVSHLRSVSLSGSQLCGFSSSSTLRRMFVPRPIDTGWWRFQWPSNTAGKLAVISWQSVAAGRSTFSQNGLELIHICAEILQIIAPRENCSGLVRHTVIMSLLKQSDPLWMNFYKLPIVYKDKAFQAGLQEQKLLLFLTSTDGFVLVESLCAALLSVGQHSSENTF